ncbi:aldo/keto reductase [Fodinicola acaciae]|uniref:aldo/keto reductase n=1 Tax=Fodinicola acaciae TaxID=2681555 RepID=UPI0013D05D0E|nr:aldo/keto reductase [Fodinicola acaciae]
MSLPLRQLGKTGLRVTPVCVGTGVLGGMAEIFGYDVDTDRAVATVREALRGPINFLDTSAGYGGGESERRVGLALADGIPDGFVVATKVDPDPGTGGYAGSDVRRSAERSLKRLGLDRFPLLYLHDPERIGFEAAMARGGAVEELVKLRDEGVAEHLGVAGGPVDLMTRFVHTGLFDVALTHNRFTLLDRSAEPLIAAATAAGVAVVNAAVFNGGMLVKGPRRQPRFAYRTADREIVQRAREIQRACATFGVELGAAALQFSLRDKRISSTVVGVSRPERIAQTVRWASEPLPDELWQALDAR